MRSLRRDALARSSAASVYAVSRRWLFGGEHGGAARTEEQTRHGCPGREPGLLALAGIIKALLERKSLRRERRFLLSYEKETLSPSKSA